MRQPHATYQAVVTTGQTQPRYVTVRATDARDARAAALAVAMRECPEGWHYVGAVVQVAGRGTADGTYGAGTHRRLARACRERRVETRAVHMGLHVGGSMVDSTWYRLAA